MKANSKDETAVPQTARMGTKWAPQRVVGMGKTLREGSTALCFIAQGPHESLHCPEGCSSLFRSGLNNADGLGQAAKSVKHIMEKRPS
eukprot:6337910-Amphidinium_carterae.2